MYYKKLSPQFIFVPLSLNLRTPRRALTHTCMHSVNQSNTLNIEKNYVNVVFLGVRLLITCDVRNLFKHLVYFASLPPPLPVAQRFLTLVITLSLFPHTCQAYVQYSNETNPSHNSTDDIERIHWRTQSVNATT